MKSDVQVCSIRRDCHDRPVYSLSETYPGCGAAIGNSAPAPYNPEDPHGEYRHMRKRHLAEEPE